VTVVRVLAFPGFQIAAPTPRQGKHHVVPIQISSSSKQLTYSLPWFSDSSKRTSTRYVGRLHADPVQ